mgnify:CR=1 FL=1
MALRALVKAAPKVAEEQNVIHLYRAMVKELPRVMTIYDIDMPLKEARNAVNYHFRKHSHLKDGRVIGLLLAKGELVPKACIHTLLPIAKRRKRFLTVPVHVS